MTGENLALNVSRRQKRVAFWRGQFLQSAPLNDGERSRLEELFQTYQLLIARLIKAHTTKSEADLVDTSARLEALDREITTTFESRRLLTSEIGSAAITS